MRNEHTHYPSVWRRLYVGGALVFILVGSSYLGWNWYNDDQTPPQLYSSHYADTGLEPTSSVVTEVPAPTVQASSSASLKLPIIMYHYVEYVKDPGDIIRKKLDIVPSLFDQQVKSLLEDHYTFYYVKELPDILKRNSHFSDKNVTLTFDDGYEDFYTGAFPILKKYHVKSTVYVVNNFINKKGYLTESEIKELIQSGIVEIGAHTLDHMYLKRAPEIEAKRQIFESKKGLEERFGIRVESFAYPFGAFSDETIQMVKDAGYTSAVTTLPGSIQSKDILFTLFRYRAGMLNGPYSAKIVENLKK